MEGKTLHKGPHLGTASKWDLARSSLPRSQSARVRYSDQMSWSCPMFRLEPGLRRSSAHDPTSKRVADARSH